MTVVFIQPRDDSKTRLSSDRARVIAFGPASLTIAKSIARSNRIRSPRHWLMFVLLAIIDTRIFIKLMREAVVCAFKWTGFTHRIVVIMRNVLPTLSLVYNKQKTGINRIEYLKIVGMRSF